MASVPVPAVVEPVNLTTTTALAKAFGPVPAGQEWMVSVRVCISGANTDTFDLQIRKTGGSNGAYRTKGQQIPIASGTADIETRLPLPAGYELWCRSGAGYVDASFTATWKAA